MKNIKLFIALALLIAISTIACGPSAARNASEFQNPLDNLLDKWGQCVEVSPTATDPYCIDSDGDGFPDLVELEMGTDPNDGDMTQEEFCLNAMQTGSEYADAYCEAMGLGGGFNDLLNQAAAGSGFNSELLISILQITGDALTQILTAFAEAGKTSNPQGGTMPSGYNYQNDKIDRDELAELLNQMRTNPDTSSSSTSNRGKSTPTTESVTPDEYTFYKFDDDVFSNISTFATTLDANYEAETMMPLAADNPTYLNIINVEGSKYEYVIGTYADYGYSYEFGYINNGCGAPGCDLILTPFSTQQNIFKSYTALSYTGCKEVKSQNGKTEYDALKSQSTGAVYKFALCYKSIAQQAYDGELLEHCDYYFRANPVDCNDKSDELEAAEADATDE
ncbi:MAG: thrombospondin type 3 repeat-containing protein [Pseudomonadota bacterium]